MSWLAIKNSAGSVSVADIPVMSYTDFFESASNLLADENCRIVSYFAAPRDNKLAFFCLIADDRVAEVLIASHHYGYYSERPLESLTARHVQMHPFEREIAELYGVRFLDNPWNKPLRYPHNRISPTYNISNYPFYKIDGEGLHEVNVGPIHAGIIEPGAFRFICNGERVMHLEIALGFQHRGVETLMCSTSNRLRQTVLAESIAGDSSIAHTTAYVKLIEKLTPGYNGIAKLENERAAALELERIAVHIADTGAICGDIAYQLGQVAAEALRTIVINSTQLWCGNRFGKGMIRPLGANFTLSEDVADPILKNIDDVSKRYKELKDDIETMPSLLSRLEDCGIVNFSQLKQIGAVGVAAKAGGLARDVRATHPLGAFENMKHDPVTKNQGDIMARLMVRTEEVLQSAEYAKKLLRNSMEDAEEVSKPDYRSSLRPDSLSFSMIEGWRGEIAHIAITDSQGNIDTYKVKDPSVHNWMALALAVRGEGISDFPVCNKSFNLSYCGHDL